MLIIGIAGGTGSGKTTVVKRITDALAPGEVVVMSQDSYYRDNSGIPLEERKKLNFDQPTYSYLTCTRQKETVHLEPRNVVIVEGILALQNQKLRKMMDIKIFVEADDDDRLSRVIRRDIVERGRSAIDVLDRWEKTLKPMHKLFIEPSRRHADIVVLNYDCLDVAINIILTVIDKKLGNHKNARF